MAARMMKIRIGLIAAGMLLAGVAAAEVCTTQSQMAVADRSALASAALGLAAKVQANDVSGLRAATATEYAKDFDGIGNVVGSTAAKVKGGTPSVEQVYLLDGSQLKRGTDGSVPDAQFFCSLNKTVAEADFLIPGLSPGCAERQLSVAVVFSVAGGAGEVGDGWVLSQGPDGGRS
jgi:hypothetical protein